MPQILPTEEEGEEEEGEDQPRRKAAPPLLVISLYISKASLLLKVSHIARVIQVNLDITDHCTTDFRI